MALHLGPAQEDGGEDALLGTINTTPLVDVMLVLLIIFLITIPVVTTSVKVQLPQEPQQPIEAKPDSIIISVDARGQVYWFDTPVSDANALRTQLQALATRQPQPEVLLRGDARTPFQSVGRVLHAAQTAGLNKVRFLTDPSPSAGQ